MLKSFYLIVIAFLVLLFAACKKDNLNEPINKVNPNFVGKWKGYYTNSGDASFEFDIDSTGMGTWLREYPSTIENEENAGGEVVSNGSLLSIGGFPNIGSFHINESPTPSFTGVSFYDCITNKTETFGNHWEMTMSYPDNIGYDGAQVSFFRN